MYLTNIDKLAYLLLLLLLFIFHYFSSCMCVLEGWGVSSHMSHCSWLVLLVPKKCSRAVNYYSTQVTLFHLSTYVEMLKDLEMKCIVWNINSVFQFWSAPFFCSVCVCLLGLKGVIECFCCVRTRDIEFAAKTCLCLICCVFLFVFFFSPHLMTKWPFGKLRLMVCECFQVV